MGLHLYFAPTNELKTDLFQVQWCVSYLSQLFVFYTFLLIQRVTSSSTVTIRITLIAIWMQTITSQLCLIDNIVRLPNCKQCNIPWTRDFIPNGKCVNHFARFDSLTYRFWSCEHQKIHYSSQCGLQISRRLRLDISRCPWVIFWKCCTKRGQSLRELDKIGLVSFLFGQ